MNLTHPFLDEDGDKLREECGVFGAVNATDAAAATALGLHALQHRGQEAAGITSFDGTEFFTRRGLGHVAENFSSQEAIAELPGMMAAGHVRYSTTGGSGLRNIQPLYADLAALPDHDTDSILPGDRVLTRGTQAYARHKEEEPL